MVNHVDQVLTELPVELAGDPWARKALDLGASCADVVYTRALKVDLQIYCRILRHGFTRKNLLECIELGINLPQYAEVRKYGASHVQVLEVLGVGGRLHEYSDWINRFLSHAEFMECLKVGLPPNEVAKALRVHLDLPLSEIFETKCFGMTPRLYARARLTGAKRSDLEKLAGSTWPLDNDIIAETLVAGLGYGVTCEELIEFRKEPEGDTLLYLFYRRAGESHEDLLALMRSGMALNEYSEKRQQGYTIASLLEK